jgi:hypothetical protein
MDLASPGFNLSGGRSLLKVCEFRQPARFTIALRQPSSGQHRAEPLPAALFHCVEFPAYAD